MISIVGLIQEQVNFSLTSWDNMHSRELPFEALNLKKTMISFRLTLL